MKSSDTAGPGTLLRSQESFCVNPRGVSPALLHHKSGLVAGGVKPKNKMWKTRCTRRKQAGGTDTSGSFTGLLTNPIQWEIQSENSWQF